MVDKGSVDKKDDVDNLASRIASCHVCPYHKLCSSEEKGDVDDESE